MRGWYQSLLLRRLLLQLQVGQKVDLREWLRTRRWSVALLVEVNLPPP